MPARRVAQASQLAQSLLWWPHYLLHHNRSDQIQNNENLCCRICVLGRRWECVVWHRSMHADIRFSDSDESFEQKLLCVAFPKMSGRMTSGIPTTFRACHFPHMLLLLCVGWTGWSAGGTLGIFLGTITKDIRKYVPLYGTVSLYK